MRGREGGREGEAKSRRERLVCIHRESVCVCVCEIEGEMNRKGETV